MSDQDADYRKHLVEARQKAQDDYDKTLVLLAGGSLGLSLTFMHDIIGHKAIRSACALKVGWGLLIASLMAVLASYCVSRFALGSALRGFDRGDRNAHHGVWTVITEAFNVIASVLVVVGISLVFYFAARNLGVRS